MDLVKLTETIIKKIVKDADSVSVKEFETVKENGSMKSRTAGTEL